MIDCSNGEIRDRLPELVNGRLDGATLDLVRTHLVDCAPCQAEIVLLERTRALLIVAAPRIDTARVVQALPTPTFRTRGRSFDWRIAATIAVIVTGGGSAAVLLNGRSAPVKADSVIAVAPTVSPASVANSTDESDVPIAGDLSGLTDDELKALLGKVESMEALPAAEVPVNAPLSGVVPVGNPGSRDRSGTS